MRTGITFSAFDLLHAGHVKMHEEAKQHCDYLIVGLQTDPTLDRPTKNKPTQTVVERYIQLKACKFVDEVVPYSTEQDLEDVLKSLGLTENDLLTSSPISIVNTGNAFALIPVANEEVLKSITPNFDLIGQISEQFDLIGYYVFCVGTEIDGRDATTRMFAPRYGIEEEAGTGMAAGPLACYLYDILGVKKNRILIQQGWYMSQPSPSLIIVDLLFTGEKISKIMAGGKGITMTTVEVEV